MFETFLIRRMTIRASHRYWNPSWTDEENERVFGSNTVAHEHDFMFEFGVRGEVDPETGFLVDLSELDRAIAKAISDPLRDGDINHGVERFRSRLAQPSTEELARWSWEALSALIPDSIRLEWARVFEADDLGAEYRARLT